ncbi:MAG: MFS transporter [Rhodospirillales bacterium]
MNPALRALGPLFISIGILLAGNGLQNTLISVRGDIEGFSPEIISLFASAFFAGYITGCYVTPHAIRHVGHIRAFAVFSAVGASAILGHAIFVSPWAWIVLRAVTGVCFIGLFNVIESWVSEKSTNENRGNIFSVYRVISMAAATGGQLMLILADPATFVLFAVIAILMALSLVPVALSTRSKPAVPKRASIRMGRLYRISPLGIVGAFFTGAATSSFWAMGPLFMLGAGGDTKDVALFVTLAIIGGGLAQMPVGWLSDRMDRRIVIIAVSLVAVVSALGLSIAGYFSAPGLFFGVFIYGAACMTMYGLVVAHANDYTPRGKFVEMSGGLLLAYSVGSVIGAPIAGAVGGALGTWAIFAAIAAMTAPVCVFGLYRRTRRSGVGADARRRFAAPAGPAPEAAGASAAALDPRAAETEEEGGEPEVK